VTLFGSGDNIAPCVDGLGTIAASGIEDSPGVGDRRGLAVVVSAFVAGSETNWGPEAASCVDGSPALVLASDGGCDEASMSIEG
jgi:hypothetical protein